MPVADIEEQIDALVAATGRDVPTPDVGYIPTTQRKRLVK
jgi:hypothetical protein